MEISTHCEGGNRQAWVEPTTAGVAKHCCIVLDAELYRDRVQAPAIIAKLQQDGRLPATACVYISSIAAAARHRDYTCSDAYASFLLEDALPWIQRNIGKFERYYLVGLSLSGLQAAFTHWRYPTVFAGALCQSPSAWWNEEWLTSQIKTDRAPRRFWLSVGNQELQTDVRHAPTDLYQGVCQMDSVQRLSERLRSIGASVHYHEYGGGHDPACWATELPGALEWLLRV